MANVAAIRIDHSRLVEVEHTERLHKRELEQAAEIQGRLLPLGSPSVGGADLIGYNVPCRTVGGDYFDFFPYRDGRVAMVVADVSGKGMPASLLMSSLQARVQVLVDDPGDLADLVTRLNKLTKKNCPANRFITFFICVLNPATGELTYSNAGHNPPLLVRAEGEVEMLEGNGPPLAILGSFEYEQRAVQMNVGDVLVLFSDGVTEAANAEDEEFGEDRLGALVQGRYADGAQGIVNHVTGALAEWTGNGGFADDLTLVIARRV
jgi:serine phosphatase RsbU (regulator of sigma subunit)